MLADKEEPPDTLTGRSEADGWTSILFQPPSPARSLIEEAEPTPEPMEKGLLSKTRLQEKLDTAAVWAGHTAYSPKQKNGLPPGRQTNPHDILSETRENAQTLKKHTDETTDTGGEYSSGNTAHENSDTGQKASTPTYYRGTARLNAHPRQPVPGDTYRKNEPAGKSSEETQPFQVPGRTPLPAENMYSTQRTHPPSSSAARNIVGKRRTVLSGLPHTAEAEAGTRALEDGFLREPPHHKTDNFKNTDPSSNPESLPRNAGTGSLPRIMETFGSADRHGDVQSSHPFALSELEENMADVLERAAREAGIDLT